jgi:AbrB family looped-hinge helix DNA binding protein
MDEIMTVSMKGQITLPPRVRARLGIKAGSRIIGEQTSEGFILKKPRDFFDLKGCFRGGKIPDDEEEILSPDAGESMLRRT